MKYFFEISSNRDRMPFVACALSGVGQLQRAQTVIAARQIELLAIDRAQKLVELNAICVGITFKEKGQGRVASKAAAAGNLNERLTLIVGTCHAI